MKATVAGFACAKDVAHAIALLAQADGEGRVIAGGQSLVAAMNLGLAGEPKLIDINGIEEMRGIRIEHDRLFVGGLTRHAELGDDPLVTQHAPLLAQAVPLIAHAAIRTRGTIGGSLSHADPAAELPACVLALDAVLHVAGPNSRRAVRAEDFFHDVFVTDLAANELLVGVSLPLFTTNEVQSIRELSRRAGDFALVGLALARRSAGYRAVFFGAGPRPMLALNVMAALDAGDVKAAVDAVSRDTEPMSDSHATAAYRRHAARVLLRRCLEDLDA